MVGKGKFRLGRVARNSSDAIEVCVLRLISLVNPEARPFLGFSCDVMGDGGCGCVLLWNEFGFEVLVCMNPDLF